MRKVVGTLGLKARVDRTTAWAVQSAADKEGLTSSEWVRLAVMEKLGRMPHIEAGLGVQTTKRLAEALSRSPLLNEGHKQYLKAVAEA